MPIFEEKLICPLALRFSQDHIRPEFQKGPDMEAAIKAIHTKPGSGAYDIVLVPPFPAIEVIRGHLKNEDGVSQDDHWLSLDNRRLYCLQRAAVAHWPQRVACEVEALKAPTQDMRKKVNSSVDGLSVGIGHSPKQLMSRWDWTKEVPGGWEGDAVRSLLVQEEAKGSVEDLANVEVLSMLELYFRNEKAGTLSDSSTVEPRSPRGSTGSNDSSLMIKVNVAEMFSQESAGAWTPDICGIFEDDKGNVYNVTVATADSWTCVRKSGSGARRKFTLWYDAATDCVSWGDDWSCWASAADLRYDCSWLGWYGAKDAAKRQPRFEWWRVQSESAACKQSQLPTKNAKKSGQKVA